VAAIEDGPPKQHVLGLKPAQIKMLVAEGQLTKKEDCGGDDSGDTRTPEKVEAEQEPAPTKAEENASQPATTEVKYVEVEEEEQETEGLEEIDADALEASLKETANLPRGLTEPTFKMYLTRIIVRDLTSILASTVIATRALTRTLLRGSFRRRCGVCKCAYTQLHEFYHLMCPTCAEFNWERRIRSADMKGMVAVVTGGRIRIGYRIVLKLLRAGCFVLTTSRFPADAVERFVRCIYQHKIQAYLDPGPNCRYAREPDFESWKENLEVTGPLELSDIRTVEAFCDGLLKRFPRIHCLINNAAQTLTRPAGWYARMDSIESDAYTRVAGMNMLSAPAEMMERKAIMATPTPAAEDGDGVTPNQGEYTGLSGYGGGDRPAPRQPVSAGVPILGEGALAKTESRDGVGGIVQLTAADMKDFPAGKLDESMQPLDLSAENSWSRKLGEVSTGELLHTMAANAVAPFVMCGALRPALAATEADPRWGHIINVSALEGKFSVGKKGSGHPHTNMAKVIPLLKSLRP